MIMLEKILNNYGDIIQKQRNHLKSMHNQLDQIYKTSEEEILQIVSKRNLSTAERTEQMIRLMEERDQVGEMLDDLTNWINETGNIGEKHEI